MRQTFRHTLESFATRFHDVVSAIPMNMNVNEAGSNKETRRIENFDPGGLFCENVSDPAGFNFDPERTTQFIRGEETVGLDDIVRRCRHAHGLLLSNTTGNERTLAPVRTPGDVPRQPGCPCQRIDSRHRLRDVSNRPPQESGGPQTQHRRLYSRPEMYRCLQRAYHTWVPSTFSNLETQSSDTLPTGRPERYPVSRHAKLHP